MKLTLSDDRHPIINAKRFAIEFAECANIMSLLEISSVNMIESIARSAPLGDSPIHGYRHWLTVLSNGLAIIDATPALQSNASKLTMVLFALFHDVRREREDHCSEHGKMGAMFLTQGLDKGQAEWLHRVFGITDEVRKMAAYACELHTICEVPSRSPLLRRDHAISPIFGKLSESEALILGACLDSDRLDLGRAGIQPDPFYLFTPVAIDHALKQSRR